MEPGCSPNSRLKLSGQSIENLKFRRHATSKGIEQVFQVSEFDLQIAILIHNILHG